jgi:Transposase DDE domain group 1
MKTDQGKTLIHPKGEVKKTLKNEGKLQQNTRTTCDTFQGIVHLEWDPQAPVTPLGQLPFFVDFLNTSGLYNNWITDCPLNFKFRGPHAAGVANILGTFFLSCLSGQKRYAHITAIRNDDVNPPLLGMDKIVSEDTARRAFQFYAEDIDRNSEEWRHLYKEWENQCKQWQQKHLAICYEPLLCEPWILDVDTTVKPLYGHQEGAEIGYNPKKPGRPAHIIHTYMIAEVRLIMDSEILPGLQTPAKYTLPRLYELLDELPSESKPSVVRGDCAFGNELVLYGMELRKLNYLFKIKKTKGVKSLINALSCETENWKDAGQGWEAKAGEIQLMGWTRKRKVLVLRRPLKRKQGRQPKDLGGQLLFSFEKIFLEELTKEEMKYEYAVLVTNLNLSALSIAQLYRDRADSENVFDELKNQWGWGGYVTRDILRSQITARIVALIYNWWSLFTRLADPKKHKEAITSRPLLLYGVGRKTTHSGQTKITITQSHAKHKQAQNMMSGINKVLNWFKSCAEQLSEKIRWHLLLSMIFKWFLHGRLLGSIKKIPAGYAALGYG